ncbi:hypothetical protein B0A52_08536 [Exophiala mesophila]|uniref:Uncharacterized protein n=1 Tax=Exophiala mesophila TaxID=212818 RepID=A0A438MYA8_EXOME|nr:hypothetical protein B0A52_08536 [Exophiala mesophila]
MSVMKLGRDRDGWLRWRLRNGQWLPAPTTFLYHRRHGLAYAAVDAVGRDRISATELYKEIECTAGNPSKLHLHTQPDLRLNGLSRRFSVFSIPMSRQDIIHAYRNLHKATLKAICYSKPASHTARSILNDTFRKRPQDDFDAIRIQNTLKFLQAAADYAGYEHKILKNLLYVKWWQSHESKRTM